MKAQEMKRDVARIVLVIVAAALVAMVVLVSSARPGLAQTDPYGNGGPTVQPTLITNGTDPGDPPQDRRICCVLPFTGGDVTGFVLVGLAAVGTGTFLVRRHRRSAER